MRNLDNLDVFEILITQKLLKCPKDPFVRSSLKCIYSNVTSHPERTRFQSKGDAKGLFQCKY